ncbi:hypothetical protein V2W45_1450661, partial [Cenococcum geophilum]
IFLFVFISIFLFNSSYLTAAYAMGKHVPGSNLFLTVRARRPTKQRVYPSTERVCLPIDLSTDDDD